MLLGRRALVRACWTALAAVAVVTTASAPAGAATTARVPAPPAGTTAFGVNLDWAVDSPAAYRSRSGLAPAQFGDFVRLPLTPADRAQLVARTEQVREAGAQLFLTVEPSSLAAVTVDQAQDLAAALARVNARGVPVLLRFAHEMNGSWYPWGQQPQAYVAAFRRVADAVHASAPTTATVWSPNYAGGYPYTGGRYAAATGTPEHVALDTDRSGALSMADDPYTPYYPGDDAVDWVGLTLYHFGLQWPYGENEVPTSGVLVRQVTGTEDGGGQYEDQSALPDFHALFAVGRDKPMALSETAALWTDSPTSPGAGKAEVSGAWLDQVYGTETRAALPRLALVNWFEVLKHESETGSTVDWRATASAPLLQRLRALVASGYRFAAAGPARALSVRPSATAVRVLWQPPAGGSSVTGYRVCVGTRCRELAASARSLLVDRLARRTGYRVTVHARSSHGTSQPVTTSVRTT